MTLTQQMKQWHTLDSAARAALVTLQSATFARLAVVRESIDFKTSSVTHCCIAQRHLTGIPAQQNEARISKLYDELNALHVERVELMERL